MWSREMSPKLTDGMSPLKYGWKLEGDLLVPDLFDGDSVPSALLSDEEYTDETAETAANEGEEEKEPWI